MMGEILLWIAGVGFVVAAGFAAWLVYPEAAGDVLDDNHWPKCGTSDDWVSRRWEAR